MADPVAFLSDSTLDLVALESGVQSPEHGALVTFVGKVRNHHEGRAVSSLTYSAYGPMAERECAAIVAEAAGRWPVRVALQHRTGELRIGDDAVAVVVAAAHRGEAFEACRWVIEAVKARVPVWKREQYPDGTEAWVDPTAPTGTVPVRAS